MDENLENALDLAAKLIMESTYVVALTGAGLSADSGIPTFRGEGGLWTRIGEPSMTGYQEFLADPADYMRKQRELESGPERSHFRAAIESAVPNAGHYALAELETIGVLRMIITQNVDDLHNAAGSRHVTEIHGNRTKMRCIGCEARWTRRQFEEMHEGRPDCPECGAVVKSDTVMFGEPIPRSVLARCFAETERCDCIIVAGTSATVYPAASFPETVKAYGGLLIEANPDDTPLTSLADVALRSSTARSLPALVERVRALKRA